MRINFGNVEEAFSPDMQLTREQGDRVDNVWKAAKEFAYVILDNVSEDSDDRQKALEIVVRAAGVAAVAIWQEGK